jgi:hypothetical protein
MIFRTIATFEKQETNIVDTLWNNPHYSQLSTCYLFEGNPYSIINHKLLDDNSYVEIYVDYHSEQFYRMWYDEFKDRYVPLIKLSVDSLREQGVEIQHYFDYIDLPGLPEKRQPMASFVSRFK